MMSWYRKFIPNFSSILSPLTELTKKRKKFIWSPECQKAFEILKNLLITSPILSCPDFSHPFTIQCDASSYGLVAVLSHNIDGREQVICYLSRSLTQQECKNSTTERECLCVLWAIERLRCYHSLVWLNNLKEPRGRLGRWVLRLQQFNFEIIHRKGKDNVVPDCLSRSVPIINNINNSQTGDKCMINCF